MTGGPIVGTCVAIGREAIVGIYCCTVTLDHISARIVSVRYNNDFLSQCDSDLHDLA